MKVGRSYHTATLLADGRLLVLGGNVASRGTAPGGRFMLLSMASAAPFSAELYDPTNDTCLS